MAKVPLVLVKPNKPVSQMTKAERRALAKAIADQIRHRIAAGS